MMLSNKTVALDFQQRTATLAAVHNQLTDETYGVEGDTFAVEATGIRVGFEDFSLEKSVLADNAWRVRYHHEAFAVEMTYTLGANHNFVEKRMAIISHRDCGLRHVVLSQMSVTADGLEMISYRHPDFRRIQASDPQKQVRPPGLEPVRTFFGRTRRGGFFTGMEMPFDDSRLEGRQLTLSFAPNLKLKAGKRFECEPIYFGVYHRSALDERSTEWRPADDLSEGVLPLPSESQAMVAMTSAILGPRRHGLVATACGWHCEMEQRAYTPASLASDLRALEVLKECGVDSLGDSHPWGGENEKLHALRDGQHYELGKDVRRFLERAGQLGLQVVHWPTMNHSQPWWQPVGQPFRPDKPEWLRQPVAQSATPTEWFRDKPGNCFANRAFYDWVTGLTFDALATGLYGGWVMDGDFWGAGGYFNTTVPVECASAQHDHLPGDANFGCQRALERLIAEVRTRYPRMLIVMCRPPMDLGVWSQRHVDACFTLIESGTASSNLVGGDEVRTASRLRVQHHFFPHYLDWPLVFPSFYRTLYGDPSQNPAWPSTHIDYILLSALSCSPNLLLYLPTKTGIPDADKAEIHKWLDWGRANIDYLNVRHDLPAWPQPRKVDGSAHIIGDRGLVFLFNSGKQPLSAEFTLTDESIGLTAGDRFEMIQEHPANDRTARFRRGDTVRWEIPGEMAVVLRVQPLQDA